MLSTKKTLIIPDFENFTLRKRITELENALASIDEKHQGELLDINLQVLEIERSRDVWHVNALIAYGLAFFAGFAFLLSRGVLNP